MVKVGLVYNFDSIDKLIKENDLYEKNEFGELQPVSDDMPNGEIGEVTLPLYFEDGTVAVNFILTGYTSTSWWRCIYLCERFEKITA